MITRPTFMMAAFSLMVGGVTVNAFETSNALLIQLPNNRPGNTPPNGYNPFSRPKIPVPYNPPIGSRPTTNPTDTPSNGNRPSTPVSPGSINLPGKPGAEPSAGNRPSTPPSALVPNLPAANPQARIMDLARDPFTGRIYHAQTGTLAFPDQSLVRNGTTAGVVLQIFDLLITRFDPAGANGVPMPDLSPSQDSDQIDYDLAIATFTKAIEHNHNDATAFYNRGTYYFNQNKYDDDLNLAIDYFTKAIELDPKFADAFYNRGLAYKAIGKTTEADADFETAEELKK